MQGSEGPPGSAPDSGQGRSLRLGGRCGPLSWEEQAQCRHCQGRSTPHTHHTAQRLTFTQNSLHAEDRDQAAAGSASGLLCPPLHTHLAPSPPGTPAPRNPPSGPSSWLWAFAPATPKLRLPGLLTPVQMPGVITFRRGRGLETAVLSGAAATGRHTLVAETAEADPQC